jgi:hypothetical protein
MLPNFYREVFWRIAIFYLVFLRNGVYGIIAIIAMTQDYVSVMRRYL